MGFTTLAGQFFPAVWALAFQIEGPTVTELLQKSYTTYIAQEEFVGKKKKYFSLSILVRFLGLGPENETGERQIKERKRNHSLTTCIVHM